MPDRRLHEMCRRAAIKRVADVAVTQPVTRYSSRQASARRRLLYDPMHLRAVERPALLRTEHRLIVARLAAQLGQLLPYAAGRHDHARLAALAEYRDLTGPGSSLGIPPTQAADFG